MHILLNSVEMVTSESGNVLVSPSHNTLTIVLCLHADIHLSLYIYYTILLINLSTSRLLLVSRAVSILAVLTHILFQLLLFYIYSDRTRPYFSCADS